VPWYQDWAVFLMTGVVATLGILVYLTVRAKVHAAEDRLEEDPNSVHGSEPEPEAAPRSPA